MTENERGLLLTIARIMRADLTKYRINRDDDEDLIAR